MLVGGNNVRRLMSEDGGGVHETAAKWRGTVFEKKQDRGHQGVLIFSPRNSLSLYPPTFL